MNLEKYIYSPVSKWSMQSLSVDPADTKKTVEPSAVVIGGTSEIDIADLDLRQIERLLYMHPVIPRGIEIKANRIVSRGYSVTGTNDEYRDYCDKILENSGGIIFLKRWIEDTYAFGNGFIELVPNKASNEILKVGAIHPIYFGYAKTKQAPEGREDIEQKEKLYITFDKTTGLPVGFQQYQYVSNEIKPYGPILPLESVAHLAFDKWGDEIEGISLVKYLVNILNYILNIEAAAAEAGYRAANPRYKFNTTIRSMEDLGEFASAVANINERDSIILTDGNDVDILNPGLTNFPEYHEQFLNLLAVRLGIPKPLLLMDGTSTNKATLREETDFLRNENGADEAVIRNTVMMQIFEPACKMKFGAGYNEEFLPDFEFDEYVAGEDTLVERLKEQSLAILNLTNAALQLLSNGLNEEAKNVMALIPKQETFNENQAEQEISGSEGEEKPDEIIEVKEEKDIDVDKQKLAPATNQNPDNNNVPDDTGSPADNK